MAMAGGSQVLAAIDTTDIEAAAAQASRLGGSTGGLKLGLEFFLAHGAAGYRRVAAAAGWHGRPSIFLDLKFHDIPNTVAGAVRAVAGLEPLILNVHAAGGMAMMRAARDAAAETADRLGLRAPKLIAVTVLTSLDEADLGSVGQAAPVRDQVLRLAELTQRSGLDGVVCSPQEIVPIRQALGADFLLVTPGIRPNWAAAADQKRVMTPGEASRAGADYLVIGRPITGDKDPAHAASRIAAEIAAA
jgi:orotidine-5'-phosphate decarboxylase